MAYQNILWCDCPINSFTFPLYTQLINDQVGWKTIQLTSVFPGLWWLSTAGAHLWPWPGSHTAPGDYLTPPQFWTGQRCQCSRTANLGGGNTPLWSCLIRPGGQGTGERRGKGGATSAPTAQLTWILLLQTENQTNNIYKTRLWISSILTVPKHYFYF